MKRLLIFFITGLLLIAAVGIAGCTSEPETPAAPVSTPKSSTETADDYQKTQEYGIIAVYKTTTINEDGFESTTIITKNRVTRTAEVEVEMPIEDDNMLGQEFIVNFSTGLIVMALFDPEGLKEWNAAMGESTYTVDGEQEEMDESGPLFGYTVSKVTMKFLNTKTRELIAISEATGTGEENIKVTWM